MNTITYQSFCEKILHPVFGCCVISSKIFHPGEIICKANGMIIDKPHLHSVQIAKGKHLYDPNFAGLITHSCDPNLFFDQKHWIFIAVKRISKGDMFTQDYELTEDSLVRPFLCRCSSINCRGLIGGKLYFLPDFCPASIFGYGNQGYRKNERAFDEKLQGLCVNRDCQFYTP